LRRRKLLADSRQTLRSDLRVGAPRQTLRAAKSFNFGIFVTDFTVELPQFLPQPVGGDMPAGGQI
jgi:hypothetical protein